MAQKVDSKFLKVHTMEGSYLKHCRVRGGAGLALITIGIMLAVITVFFAVLLGVAIAFPMEKIILILSVAAAFIVIFVIPGMILHKKRAASYLDHYSKKTGYTPEQLMEFDKEVSSPDSVLVNPYELPGKLASNCSGVITAHWCRFAINYPEILRVADIAAIWFDPKPIIDRQQYSSALFFIDSKGKLSWHASKEGPTKECIAEIAKRNPKTITAKNFAYGDQEYNAQAMPEEVAALYRSVCEEL